VSGERTAAPPADGLAGPVRVPFIRQTGASDCGLAALEMILRYHGAEPPRHALRRLFGDTAGGASLDTLRTVARGCGFDAEGFEVPPDTLEALPAPAILHWRRGHFVVFEGLAPGGVSIVDPVGGRVLMPHDQLARLYSGYALVLEPVHPPPRAAGTGDGRSDAARSVLSPWLGRERAALVRLGAVALGIGAAASAAVLWLADAVAGILAAGVAHAAPTIVGAALAAAAAAGLSVRAVRMEAELTAKLGAFLAQRFAEMTAAAPYNFLASRTGRFLENLAGDLDPAVNPRIPSLRCMRLLGLALAAAAALLTTSPGTGAAVLASFVGMAAGAEWRTRRWNARAARWRGAVQSAREWGRAVLARPLELRAAGTLSVALERWSADQARAHAAFGGGPAAPPEPHPAWLGAAFVAVALVADGSLQGARPPGALQAAAVVLAVMGLMAMHAALGEIARFRAWAATLAILADACREVPAPAADPAELAELAGAAGATDGMLWCRSLVYVAGGERRLSSTSLEVRPGEAVAVTGDVEARTAFAHLVLGLVAPSEGRVTIGGMDVAGLDETRRRDLVAGVTVGAEPLAATILENFRMVDPACGPAAVLDACARAGLGDWLASLPLAERTPLSPGALPGAVRRQLCLARLLVRLPRVLVLDGTLDELGTEQARDLAGSLVDLPCTVLLCTGRTDFLPPEFRPLPVSSSDAG
jgi:ABC-type transport system involved in cytochrome bd biosynthesis fused ATPase/permease subunit